MQSVMSVLGFWISTNAFITLSLRGTIMTSCSSATIPTQIRSGEDRKHEWENKCNKGTFEICNLVQQII